MVGIKTSTSKALFMEAEVEAEELSEVLFAVEGASKDTEIMLSTLPPKRLWNRLSMLPPDPKQCVRVFQTVEDTVDLK